VSFDKFRSLRWLVSCHRRGMRSIIDPRNVLCSNNDKNVYRSINTSPTFNIPAYQIHQIYYRYEIATLLSTYAAATPLKIIFYQRSIFRRTADNDEKALKSTRDCRISSFQSMCWLLGVSTTRYQRHILT
jgi:hypothetical protein